MTNYGQNFIPVPGVNRFRQQPQRMQAPLNNRNAMIQKLFQQYQAGRAGSNNSGGGTPFRSATQSMAAPRTQLTGPNNVAESIRAALGPGGYGVPLPGEGSMSSGGAINAIHPQSLPMMPSIPLPLPGGGAPTPQSAPPISGGTGDITPAGDSSPVVNSDGTVFGARSGLDGGLRQRVANDAVSLGGGVYYSPTQGYINMSADSVNLNLNQLGGAAKSLGTALPT